MFYQQIGNNKSVVIKGAPVGGWMYTFNTTDQPLQPLMPPNDYPHWIENTNGGYQHNDSCFILWDAYLLPKCVDALGNNSWLVEVLVLCINI